MTLSFYPDFGYTPSTHLVSRFILTILMTRQNLWAPWRMDYIRQLEQPNQSDCFLCDAWKLPDESDERLIIHRNDQGMILLNRYPYTNGHLLVALAEHVGELSQIMPDKRAILMELTATAERILQAAINPQGINIGMNLGRCAGAGLPGHLHVHLVPRWNGDTNFMATVGDVRVVPQSLQQIHSELKAVVNKVL